MREIKFRLWCKTKNEWESDEWHILRSGAVFDFRHGRILNPKNHILMQYTGLKDKNGKEIYEGDILKPLYNRIKPFEVKFDNGKYNASDYDLKHCEVIGNIYEEEAFDEPESQ